MAKATKPPCSARISLAEMVDELGALEKEYELAMAPLNMKMPRIKALKSAIQLACNAPADQEWTAEGARFGVKLGPCAKERTINLGKLVKSIGAAVFAKFATCTLKDLEANVEPKVMNSVVSIENSGPRKLSTFEKGVAAAA